MVLQLSKWTDQSTKWTIYPALCVPRNLLLVLRWGWGEGGWVGVGLDWGWEQILKFHLQQGKMVCYGMGRKLF